MRRVKQAQFQAPTCKIVKLHYSDELLYCTQHASLMAQCYVCGQWFHTDRPHAWTCGDRCRKAKSRGKCFQKSVTSQNGAVQNG